MLHRNIGVPAYGEGWGLYSEQLADEIGMYADFRLGRIGMIQSFMYRAARIVIDTGMHAKGWSREQSIRYFTENVGLDPISATSEVERYVVWPGQACSYKIGHNEIVRLREEARARLGARFDLKCSTTRCCWAATCRWKCSAPWSPTGPASGWAERDGDGAVIAPLSCPAFDPLLAPSYLV